MMNRFKTSLNLTICLGLLLGSVDVYAKEKAKAKTSAAQTPKVAEANTANSYGAFCGNGAGIWLQKLNDVNDSKIKQIEELRTKLADLEQTNSIIVEVSDLKNKYEKGLKEITDSARERAATKKSIETANLDSMKSIIRNGLTLNALALLLKDDHLDSKDSAKMSSLCAKPENKDQLLCKKKDPANPSEKTYFTTSIFGYEGHKLDKTLEAFKESHNRLSSPEQQKNLRDEVSKIIASIPKDIAPEAILKIIEAKSPQTLKLLSTNFPREKLFACLDEKSSPESTEACKGLIENPGYRQELIGVVGKEAKAFGESLAQSHAPIIDAAATAHKAELNTAINNIISNAQSPNAIMGRLIADTSKQAQSLKPQLNSIVTQRMQQMGMRAQKRESEKTHEERTADYAAKTENKLVGLASLFYIPPATSGMDMVDVAKVQKKAEIDANEKARRFDNKCSFSGDPAQADSLQIEECKKLLSEIIPKINLMQKNHAEEAYNLQNEIKKISASDDFTAVEALKKYVVERYQRSCSQESKKIKSTDQSMRLNLGCTGEAIPLQTLTQVEGLGDAVFKIANTINPIADSPEFAFSKAELESFKTYCSNLTDKTKSTLSDICGTVESDKIARSKKKDTKEWEEFNNKYWVNYDESSPSGYRKIEKKSTMRIIGEGVLPVVPGLIPIWFGNYQMQNNIEMLTNQALYQKQMLHTMSVYNNSPWMYSYNYFGFSPFGLSGSTGTTGTTTTSTGFNFGQ